jgi:hypothetical protein
MESTKPFLNVWFFNNNSIFSLESAVLSPSVPFDS